MKHILFVTMILLGISNARAFTVESGYIQKLSGQYVKATKISCDASTGSYCQQICGEAGSCQRIEPYCRNCAGTTSPLLRQLFTELSRVFSIQQKVSDMQPLIGFLSGERYVLLDLNSIFNYYTPVGGEAFLNELTQFCGANANTALLAVSLDEVHQPQKLNYVLCRDNAGKTAAFDVSLRTPGMGFRLLKTQIYFNLN
ncbi:hypothetical protein ACLVWU_04425 [Bdellovibrio sp. HCB290]|uniref:hypothetical protein n=1 Tax=Bdellovibrio sp. HCB290 TaxID=3394356 RepID=UPI0039B4432F